MNSDYFNSTKRESDCDNEYSDPINCISDETNVDANESINIMEDTNFDECATTRDDERNEDKSFQNARKTQISSTNPTIKKSKTDMMSIIRVKHGKEIINYEKYDEDNNGVVGTNRKDPDVDNIYDDDDQIDISRDDIQQKNIIDLNFTKAKLSNKTKKNQRFGEFVSSMKLLNQKDKISQNSKCSSKQSKSKSTKVIESNFEDDEIYDEDGDQMENEGRSTLIMSDEIENPNNTERMQHVKFKNTLDEEYDQDNDLENLKEANLIKNSEKVNKSFLFKSSKFFKKGLKGQDIDCQSNLKNSKSKILKEKQGKKHDIIDGGELYDEDLWDPEKESDCIVLKDSTKIFQKDQSSLKEPDDIYDEDEDFQVNIQDTNDEFHSNCDRSSESKEKAPRKSSKLNFSKKYVNQQVKNLKIKEKFISDYIKRKIQNVKQMSTGSREDKAGETNEYDLNEIREDDLDDLYDDFESCENSLRNSIEACELKDSSCSSETRYVTCPALDKISEHFKNFETKDKSKNQLFTKSLDKQFTSKGDDTCPIGEKDKNNPIKRDDEIYDDDEEENEILLSNFNFDVYSTDSETLTDSSSKLEHMRKFMNEKITKLKKSKKLMANRLILKLKTRNDILDNQMASNEDENDKDNVSNSSLIRKPVEKDLKNRHDDESTNNSEHQIQEERLRNTPNDIIGENKEYFEDLQSSNKRSAVKKIDDTKPLKTFKQKLNFSENFQLKMKKLNSNFRNKNIVDAELSNEDSVKFGETLNNDEEYFYENEKEKEKRKEDKYQKDSQAIKGSNSDEVLIHEKSDKPSKFQSSFEYLNKHIRITKRNLRNNDEERHHLCQIKQNDSQKVCDTDRNIEKNIESEEICENTNLKKLKRIEKLFPKVKKKSEGLIAISTNPEWYSLEVISRENEGENIHHDFNKSITVNTFENHTNTSELKKTEDMKIEILNEESKDKEASIPKITRSDSFPLIKKRYNLQMCLEYFDMSREIVDIKTEILDNGQQMVHITLGEAGKNLTLKRNIEKHFRTNIKVKTSSRNETNTDIKYKNEETNKLFNKEINKKEIKSNKGLFQDCKDKNESDKDDLGTCKQISWETVENSNENTLNIPPKIPDQNKVSTRDIDSKHNRKIERNVDRDDFESNENKLILGKTDVPLLNKNDASIEN